MPIAPVAAVAHHRSAVAVREQALLAVGLAGGLAAPAPGARLGTGLELLQQVAAPVLAAAQAPGAARVVVLPPITPDPTAAARIDARLAMITALSARSGA
jgi:hypothetical protein